MKKLLLILALVFISCSPEEIQTEDPCDCEFITRAVLNIPLMTTGGITLRVTLRDSCTETDRTVIYEAQYFDYFNDRRGECYQGNK
jgi:hypothetical protein